MPRIEFTTSAKKATTNYDYPKLKLKVGERARILLLESPVMEYVHTLRAPVLANGVPVMETKKRKDDSEYKDNKMEFLGRPLCLGDIGILDDKGSDPTNCPMCALAKENSDFAQAPQRRFAMHVIKYRIKGDAFNVATPFAVETVVWAFADKTFNKIVDMKEEWGNLQKHDLTLGPCTNENFQQFDISVSAKAEWLVDDERKKLTVETFKENQIEDLSIACGTKKERKWIDEDLTTIRNRWNDVFAASANEENAAATKASLDDGLDDLLNSSPAKKSHQTVEGNAITQTTWAPPAEVGDGEDLLAGLLDGADLEATKEEAAQADAEASPETAPAKPAAASKEEAPAKDADSFEDLLANFS